jgi:hypothetical protein
MEVTVYLKSGNTVHASFEEDGPEDLSDVLLDPGVGQIVFQEDDGAEFLIPKDNIDYIKVYHVQ